MEKTRMSSVLQTLDKVMSGRSTRHGLQNEDIQQLRYVTSKLLHYLQSQEKIYRDILVKHASNIENLFAALEAADDSMVTHNIIEVLLEYVGKTHTSKRASTLVNFGAIQILFTVLVSEARDSPDELIVSMHSLLGRLGPKDRRFAVKARLSQALPVTLSLIRNHCQNFRILQPAMTVLKLYAANAVNASYLGKNGAISYIFKILSLCGRKHLTLLKLSLDTLVSLVKSKSNSARAIGHGGVPSLLHMFSDWHRLDTKNRHIALRKAILGVLKNITNLKSGRRAFMDADGIRTLYNACQETLQCRELESVIFVASLIMRKCFPRNKLPLSTVRSPFRYPLPQSEFHTPEVGGSDYAMAVEASRSNTGGDEDKSDESSLDNDDDISSDDDADPNKMESEIENETEGQGYSERSPDDLAMYEGFFPELFEFQVEDEDSDEEYYQRDKLTEQLLRGSVHNETVSDSVLYQHTHARENEQYKGHSMHHLPNGHTGSFSVEHNLMQDLSSLQLTQVAPPCGEIQRRSTPECTRSLPKRSGSASSSSGRARLQGLFQTAPDEPSSSAIAINQRTGSSVFSISFSPPKNQGQPLLKGKNVKSRRKGLRSAKGGRKRIKARGLSSASDPNFFGMSDVTSHDFLDDTASEDTQEEDGSSTEDVEIFREMASKTVSVGRFSKIAYPEMYGIKPPPYSELLYERKFGIQRQKIFEDIDRMINPERLTDKVVYDLDTAVNMSSQSTGHLSTCCNADEIRISGHLEDGTDHLRFNSQFECGNLRKATQVRQYEYDLILNPDVNTNHHHQWFYFEVSHMEAGKKYRFNIVNCEKLNSQFNFGMKPVMFSVKESLQGRPYWSRAGSEICYYRNHFTRSSNTTGGVRGKPYYTTTFTVKFKHSNDICYLAYHYPYSYTMLQAHIRKWEASYDSDSIYYRNQELCSTISGNSVPVLTITSYPQSMTFDGINQFQNKPYIVLTGRVHPGESNSSWVMKGSIQFLLSDRPMAQTLRDMYIFKIVPMLNPDGVINGNHRCSLVAEDLNRRWPHPCPKLHPTIYHTKGLLQYLKMIKKTPLVYCDYHGHSRRKNVFLYGCSPSMSWMSEDLDNPAILPDKIEDIGYKTLPRILSTAPSFSLSNCSFEVEKSKETTARVVVWRKIGVIRSYTMESTYCGCDQGPYKGRHINTQHLEEMGRKFCEALIRVKSRHVRDMVTKDTVTNDNEDLIGATASYEAATYEDASQNDWPIDDPVPGSSEAVAANMNSESSSGSETDDEDDENDEPDEAL